MDQASPFHLQVESLESDQAAASRDAQLRGLRMTWLFQRMAVAALVMLIGVAALGSFPLPSHSEARSGPAKPLVHDVAVAAWTGAASPTKRMWGGVGRLHPPVMMTGVKNLYGGPEENTIADMQPTSSALRGVSRVPVMQMTSSSTYEEYRAQRNIRDEGQREVTSSPNEAGVSFAEYMAQRSDRAESNSRTSSGKGFGGGEATRDPEPTYIDPNDPRSRDSAVHKADSYADYMARRRANDPTDSSGMPIPVDSQVTIDVSPADDNSQWTPASAEGTSKGQREVPIERNAFEDYMAKRDTRNPAPVSPVDPTRDSAESSTPPRWKVMAQQQTLRQQQLQQQVQLQQEKQQLEQKKQQLQQQLQSQLQQDQQQQQKQQPPQQQAYNPPQWRPETHGKFDSRKAGKKGPSAADQEAEYYMEKRRRWLLYSLSGLAGFAGVIVASKSLLGAKGEEVHKAETNRKIEVAKAETNRKIEVVKVETNREIEAAKAETSRLLAEAEAKASEREAKVRSGKAANDQRERVAAKLKAEADEANVRAKEAKADEAAVAAAKASRDAEALVKAEEDMIARRKEYIASAAKAEEAKVAALSEAAKAQVAALSEAAKAQVAALSEADRLAAVAAAKAEEAKVVAAAAKAEEAKVVRLDTLDEVQQYLREGQ